MTNWNLDKICKLTTKPDFLNALHACRRDPSAFANAAFLAAQQPAHIIPYDAVVWLRKQAGAA